MIKKIFTTLLLTLLTITTFAEVLPQDKVFIPSSVIKDNNLVITFDIKEEYYLYKNKLRVEATGDTKFGDPTFSKAKLKNDEFFGEIEAYYKQAEITLPILSDGEQVTFEVFFQGCWEGGVCYPPNSKKMSVNRDITTSSIISSNKNSSNSSNFFKALTQQGEIEDPANVDIAFKFDIVKVDDSTLRATWDVRDEYYLYHDKFNFEIDGADFGTIHFPQGTPKHDEFFGDITIHKKQLSVDIPLLNASDSVDVTISYQGCWEGGVCYPPVRKKQTIVLQEKVASVNVAPTPKAATEQKAQQQTTKPIQNTTTTIAPIQKTELNEEESIAKEFTDSSFLWILISFFGFGILAAFTSCILPMIPILSGLIIGSGNPSKKKAFMMSLTFVVFMSLTYAIVGVIFGLFGSNLQATLQNPWVITTFSLIFVALAFSMFGYYEIKIPNWLQAKLTTISNKQEGGHFIGVAVMGVLSALIVGPCSAPVLSGALLYISQSGDAVLGGSALFVLGLGMGLPLLVAGVGVATPRAGVWMDTIKAIFGIAMLGVAIFFLERILDEDITIMMWATLLTIAPIALGVTSIKSEEKPLTKIFKAIGFIILGYGILLWVLVARGGVSSGGEMFAPLKGLSGGVVATAQVQKLNWTKIDTLDELNNLTTTTDKLVMVDFYADWCTYCKVYEKEVFAKPIVIEKLGNAIPVKIDITDMNDNHQEILSAFNVSAPPMILFFKGGVELKNHRIVGEKNLEEFLQILGNIQ